ncbi:MAG: hypothetical protein JXR95_09345 [Deltaproteobacteria bacterium]|nr:hypothetical protein [Deltaproteobacteria bacterium]
MSKSIFQRRGLLTFIIFIFTLIYYTPFLGSYGLFDPWETHYGEVARTMLQRDDYISTYWQDEGFYSKPVLLFWMQSAGMALAGLNKTGVDHPAEMAESTRPEWALRLPVAILSSLAVASVFFLVFTFFSFFAAFLSSVFLAITPHYALVSRQSITDMPFLALMTIAMVLFILGLSENRNISKLKIFSTKIRGNLQINITSVFIINTLLVIAVFPQYMLMAANVDASTVFIGKRIQLSGFLVFIPYLLLALETAVSNIRGKTTLSSQFIQGGFVFAGLAILAKGFGALVIPAATFFIYFLVSKKWEKIKDFDILKGILIIIAVSFPWHHAMMIRHGNAFFQEYIVHHHFKRAALGVHGERGIFTYYLTQMAFGLFVLLPILPAAISWHYRKIAEKKPDESFGKSDFSLILIIWASVTFLLFSTMLTKFHHYILPVTVPLAVLSGIFISEFKPETEKIKLSVFSGLILAILTLREFFLDSAHFINLFIYKYERLFPYEYKLSTMLAITGFGVIFSTVVYFVFRKKWAALIFALSGAVFTGNLIYSYIPTLAPHWSQKQLHQIYFQCRQDSSERFIAWQLNWRGENFYSKNQVLPHMDLNSKDFLAYLRRYSIKEKGTSPSGRFLLLEIHRLNRLKNLMDKEFYKKNPEVYSGKTSKELVSIIGPDCKTVPDESEKHFRMKNFSVLKAPYPHNKFILVRIMI